MSSQPAPFSLEEVVGAAGPDPNLKAALPFVLHHEGMVLEEVPGDPGGATLCGITHADYDAFRHEHGLPLQVLGRATAAEVAACYREHYWRPCQCAKVPFPLALTLFDSAVLLGPVRPIRWMQAELGVGVDGVLGQITLGAVGSYVEKHGEVPLAQAVLTQRQTFHRARVEANPKLSQFLKGWLKRVDDLEAEVMKV